jgi:hypothetical protein
MDFSLTFDQQMMVEATKKMVETKILPVLKSSPKNQSLTKEAALKIFAIHICAYSGRRRRRRALNVGLRAHDGANASIRWADVAAPRGYDNPHLYGGDRRATRKVYGRPYRRQKNRCDG